MEKIILNLSRFLDEGVIMHILLMQKLSDFIKQIHAC